MAHLSSENNMKLSNGPVIPGLFVVVLIST